ncbi:hypothetical protein LPJ61_001804 [Coemansia biformis]|uniref:Dbl homology domain-containing protein n=1 Tax=Coemansia biformis TaxID=1286918 RepID=A0A9W7YG71_9FUNG|nr:hypothetical protein LPJ61_001804 [Coemansia biformis]
MMAEDPRPGSAGGGDGPLDEAQPQLRMLAHRARIAAEILDTERTYVDGLGLIEKLYIGPLLASAQQQAPILSRKEVRQLFANFPDIVSLSKELLAQLDARLGPRADPPWDPATGRVGDVFVRMAPFLKVYSLYLRNFRSALADVSRWLSENHDFARFIHQAGASPESKGLPLQSYLLLPVQRIPRYKLLLTDLLKHTPDAHVDRQSISDALHTIAEVAAFVNENIEEHEMTLSILEIQRTLGLKEPLLVPGRRLVKAGVLTKICRKNHQQRSFYLFNDMLLYSSGPAPLLDDQAGHRRVQLADCKVMDVPDAPDCRNQLTIISREKSFIVYADTAAGKAKWMAALSAAIVDQRRARETLQMDRSLRRRIARTRRSTMMHFPRVAENYDAPVWDPDESADQCYICFRAFTLFMRRHHCRACGKIVCNACSRKSIIFVGHASAETKEGRGCDQCIARMFGREALESPPGTIHRLLSRSRHSLDPASLIQSLSSLKVGAGSVRQLPPASRPSAPWSARRASCSCSSARSIGLDAAIPSQAPGSARSLATPSLPATPRLSDLPDLLAAPPSSSSPKSAAYLPRPPTPVPAGVSSSRHSSASDPSSPMPCLPRQSANPSQISAPSAAKHVSTSSTLDWESLPASARSTLLYEALSPTMLLTGASSPMSTISHHRVSLVSSSCSTIGPEPVRRPGHVRARWPISFAAADAAGGGAEPTHTRACTPPASGSSHCSLLALYESASPTPSGSVPSLLSAAAPPKVTLVQAEAVARRQRKPTAATLCSLCHGDFTMQDSQYQCTSCLSLVCPRCIRHRPTGPPAGPDAGYAAPDYMYIHEDREHTPGDPVCISCAAHSSPAAGTGAQYTVPSAC